MFGLHLQSQCEFTNANYLVSIMILSEKIKLMRVTEGITQKEFSQLTEIPLVSIKFYETDRRQINFENLIKITSHSQFRKYALWLVSDDFKMDIENQIAPANIDDLEEY